MITNIGLKQLGFTDADYLLQDDGDGVVYIAKWKSKERSQPTEAEIETAESEWQAEYDSQAYARARAKAYPSIGDQLDMQYHDQTEGSRTWLDAVEAVKEAYPK
jgi:ABC-type branched-subunit amino acid transport system substrate-binding protein